MTPALTAVAIVELVLGIVDGGLKLAAALLAKVDPQEATTARLRLAKAISDRALQVASMEASWDSAVPKVQP